MPVFADRLLVVKFLFAVLTTSLIPFAMRWAGESNMKRSAFQARVAIAHLAIRLGLAFALFFVLGASVPSDASSYYYPQAEHARAGQLVYRDFSSSYGPLFPYVGAILISMFRSPIVFVVFAVLVELGALLLWMQHRGGEVDSATVRKAAAAFVLCPVSVLNVAVAGQNQVWIALLVVLSLIAVARSSPFASGLALGFAVAGVKILALLFGPLLLLGARKPVRWLAGAGLVCAGSYAGVWLLGGNPIPAMLGELSDVTSGNLPFLLAFARVPVPQILPTIVVAGGVLTFLWVSARRNTRVENRVAGVLLIFMMCSRKSYPSYLNMALFPLAYVAVGASPFGAAILLMATIAAAIEPSLVFRWFSQPRVLLESSQMGVRELALIAVDLVLLAGYALLLSRSLCNRAPAGREVPAAPS